MGIVLKIERIPINIGLGICLGMVPLVAFSYGAGNKKRMDQVAKLAADVANFAVSAGVFMSIRQRLSSEISAS